MSKAVSFSRASLYKKCPASFEWQYILGNRDESGPGPAASRGTRIHNSIENYFLNTGDLDEEIPREVVNRLAKLKEAVDREDCQVWPEMPFALTDEWVSCDFDAEEAYVRGFMDNVFIYPDRLLIHEYKTGGEYDEHADQKQLYAMIALMLFEYDSVEVVGVYIDKKKVVPTVYSRAHLTSMKFVWENLIKKMHIPIYPARPGIHCRWCPKSNKKEGPCQLG